MVLGSSQSVQVALENWQASHTVEWAAFKRVQCWHCHCSPEPALTEGAWPGDELAAVTSCSSVDQWSPRRQASAPSLSPATMALQRLGMYG